MVTGQTGHSCSINKRSPTRWKCTNRWRWSDRSSMPNQKRSHTSWKCTNKARWSDRSFMLNQQKVTYILEVHKQGEIVRLVIHAQPTKGHVHPGNAQTRGDGQTGHACSSINKKSHTAWKCTNKAKWSGHSCSINKRSHTAWKCTNKVRWSDRPFILNQQRSHTAWKCTNKARWSDRSFMPNQQKVTYKLEMHNQGEMVRQVIHAQSKVTYILEMHKQGKIVRQVIHAQSTKGHLQSGNAQTRGDGQTGHGCSINKRSHTRWKCTNEARWSDRSFMLNQQKVTYSLEIHKRGEIVRQVIHAQSTKGHVQTRLLGKSSIAPRTGK